MPAKGLSEEFGYSLVEVMASIVIFAIAIIPMVGMFDMGLNSATTGSNYDKARALANQKLEQAKSLTFATTRDNFPETAPTTTPYDGSGYYQSAWKTEPGADFANFDYQIEKQYIDQPPTDSVDPPDPADPTENFEESPTATTLIRVTVTVRWPDGNDYTTYGLVTQ
jgi:hypothetical protein